MRSETIPLKKYIEIKEQTFREIGTCKLLETGPFAHKRKKIISVWIKCKLN